MSLCTKRCRECYYSGSTSMSKKALGWRFCDYLCVTGRRRPCPAGDQCTEFRRGRRKHSANGLMLWTMPMPRGKM